MSSYYYWVKKKIGEDSPIGDLARDIMLEQARYRSFPINSQSFRRLLGHFETKYEFLGLRLDEGKWKKTTDEMMLWAKEAF